MRWFKMIEKKICASERIKDDKERERESHCVDFIFHFLHARHSQWNVENWRSIYGRRLCSKSNRSFDQSHWAYWRCGIPSTGHVRRAFTFHSFLFLNLNLWNDMLRGVDAWMTSQKHHTNDFIFGNFFFLLFLLWNSHFWTLAVCTCASVRI